LIGFFSQQAQTMSHAGASSKFKQLAVGLAGFDTGPAYEQIGSTYLGKPQWMHRRANVL